MNFKFYVPKINEICIPSKRIYYDTGILKEEHYLTRKEPYIPYRPYKCGPASIYYYPNGNMQKEEYIMRKKLIDSSFGPYSISYHLNGNIQEQLFIVNTKNEFIKIYKNMCFDEFGDILKIEEKTKSFY